MSYIPELFEASQNAYGVIQYIYCHDTNYPELKEPLDKLGLALDKSALEIAELKRLQNENMCLREDNDKLVAMVIHWQDKLRISQSDLTGKNWMLDKALIDVAILVQEVTYLKEQNALLKRVK